MGKGNGQSTNTDLKGHQYAETLLNRPKISRTLRYGVLIKHMNTNSVDTRVHGNIGKKTKYALKFDDVKRVFDFIISYSDTYGMSQLAAPRGRDDIPPIFRQSSVTKKAVHDLNRQSCEDINVRVVSLRVVYDIWNQCCRHI